MTVAKLAGGVKRRKDVLCWLAKSLLPIFTYFDRRTAIVSGPTCRGGSRTAPTTALAPNQSQGFNLPGLHMEVDGLALADCPQDHILQ